ncbi:hypothetical protein [Streptomyces sp. NPDC059994]|uniref:hypothetical protein n=1 Tax=Streptomyces sp. NPDC059994 TaxID=3347029 RepID=UPI0036C6D570
MARRRSTPKPTPAQPPAASPAIPTSTAQAQAATQAAEALLDQARREADTARAAAQEQALEIVRAAHEEQQQVRDKAAACVAQMVAGAEQEADRLVEEAQARASRIRTDADTEAVDRQAGAELAAQRAEKAGQARADEVRDQAHRDAEQLREDAAAKANRIITDAAAEASQTLTTAQGKAEQILADAAAAAEKAQKTLLDAQAQAEWTTEEAKGLRARTLAAADFDASRIRDEAQQHLDTIQARTDAKERRGQKIDEWSPRVALGATILLTASGELSLAVLTGWPPAIAWGLPLAIDIYVVQAMRRHRDVMLALLLMVAANAIYHLAEAGLFGVRVDSHGTLRPEWWLIAAVAAIAPWVMLRIHRITAPPRARRTWRRSRPEAPAATLTEAPALGDSGAHDERAQAPAEQEEEVPAVSVPERSPGAPTERPSGRPGERAQRPKTERAHRAHPKPKKGARPGAPKTLTERRTERVKELYSERGKRPEWTDIRDALVTAKLADKTISRSSCQRVRDAIEAEHPELAALGSDNVRAITGS